MLMDQSSRDVSFVGVGPPGPTPGTPSHFSPKGQAAEAFPGATP
jgi:hypothetical protein